MTNNSYAIALFDISKEDNALKLCQECFEAFMRNYNGDVKSFFTSPNIDGKAKKEVVSNAFFNVYENFVYFINVVIDNHRESMIEEIYDGFIELFNETMKIKKVKIVSKVALTEQEYQTLYNSLTKYFSGYKVVINNEIDAQIIGGYKIYADGNSLDFSLNKVIADYKAQF